jgi:heme exporter protein D
MPAGRAGALADFVEFLKRTRYVWLTVAVAIFGVMTLVTVQKRMAEQAKAARAARQEHAVATITLEALLTRCGQPAEDVTKDMYPMLVRTMTYQPRENEKVVFEFSRTAEEKSEWVFLSMKDASGASKLDTPEAKIAALPCLDTKK